MKFLGKMCLKITLKVTKTKVSPSLQKKFFFEKPYGVGGWGQIDPPAVLELNKLTAKRCRFVEVYVTFLLPPGIKGLTPLNSFLANVPISHLLETRKPKVYKMTIRYLTFKIIA